MQDLIANVKRNKDIGLNEELDEIMDVEIKFEYPHKFRDGYDSDRGFPIPPFFREDKIITSSLLKVSYLESLELALRGS